LSGARRLPHIGPAGGSSPVGGTVDPAVNTTPSLFSVSDPQRPSEAAARSLPVAYPERAAWGTVSKLRAWQAEALELYRDRAPKAFLAVATPGAGKTAFALQIAAGLLSEGSVRRIPRPLHRARTEADRTPVILAAIHPAGDSRTWGHGVRDAFHPATRRLALTGTPFRSDDSQIPLVTYEEDGEGFLRSKADYTYGYGDALRDHVVRPVLFMTYSGRMHWRTKSGDEVSAQLGAPETKDITQQAWRTALDPKGEWIQSVLSAADR